MLRIIGGWYVGSRHGYVSSQQDVTSQLELGGMSAAFNLIAHSGLNDAFVFIVWVGSLASWLRHVSSQLATAEDPLRYCAKRCTFSTYG